MLRVLVQNEGYVGRTMVLVLASVATPCRRTSDRGALCIMNISC